MLITGMNHVAVFTGRFAELKRFYTETLGLPVVGAYAGRNIVFVQAGGTTIEIVERNEGPAVTSGGWDHVAFTVTDIDAAYAELVAKGVMFHVAPFNFPDPPETRIAFFKDPDGNVLELAQPLGASLYPQRGL